LVILLQGWVRLLQHLVRLLQVRLDFYNIGLWWGWGWCCSVHA